MDKTPLPDQDALRDLFLSASFFNPDAPYDASVEVGILDEASSILRGYRNSEYGPPEHSFDAIARLWSAYLDSDISPREVGVMMALLKIARSIHAPGKRDNYVDLAGYAALAGGIAEDER